MCRGNYTSVNTIGQAGPHFNLSSPTPEMKLSALTAEWSLEIENRTGKIPDNNWLTGLALGIWRGIRKTQPQPISKAPLQSVSDNFWYHMLVISITDIPDGASEVSILMLRDADPKER